jgi:integrase
MRGIQVIPIQDTCNLEKVKLFLNSVGRNSQQSKRIYGIALARFQAFVKENYRPADVETILEVLLTTGQVNVYSLIDNFVSYLLTKNLAPNTIALYIAAVRSYFAYFDIDIVPTRFKRKVRMPKRLREDEEPVDTGDIRKILLSCSNRRLRSYLLVLSSSGARATEVLASRIKDYDFSRSPVKLHIRKEYAKTRAARDVYISDEAADYLQKEWLPWKYAKRRGKVTPFKSPDDLVFAMHYARSPVNLYNKMVVEFGKVLKQIGMDEHKEGMFRRRITLHTFRRYVKSVAANETSSDYSEWLLGHQKSPYWVIKETQRGEIYKNKLMPFLTFLDYGTLENTSKGIVAQLERKDKEIAFLRDRDSVNEDTINTLSDKLIEISKRLEKLEKPLVKV